VQLRFLLLQFARLAAPFRIRREGFKRCCSSLVSFDGSLELVSGTRLATLAQEQGLYSWRQEYLPPIIPLVHGTRVHT